MFDDRAGQLRDAPTSVSLLSCIAATAQPHIDSVWV
jgi:hypothetical protein